jgi:hypothetical protein
VEIRSAGRRSSHCRLAGLAGFLALGLAGAACDRGRPVDASDTAGPVQQARPAALPQAPESGSDEPALPGRGRVLVWPSARGVTVLANDAMRRLVLSALAREARFRAELVEGVALRGRITLRAVDVSLDEVFARLLEGVPYTAHYGVDAETGGRVLSHVSVGEVLEATRVAVGDRGDDRRQAERSEPPLRPAEEDWEKRERIAARQAGFLEDLASTDPEARADAAGFVRADSDTIPLLSNLVAADPNPAVRAAAAETLGEAGEFSAAVGALVSALDDPDPAVVIAAIEALEWVGEASIVPEIQFLLEHPHPEVRERTVEAIEWFAD